MCNTDIQYVYEILWVFKKMFDVCGLFISRALKSLFDFTYYVLI